MAINDFSAMNTHAAILLAAGGSTRLGQAKQLLRRGGETLVHRATRLALGTSPARMLVVVGADAERVEGELQSECEILRNHHWQEGLASSLKVAADALSEFYGPVLILACDQPALELEHLVSLLAGARCSRSGAAATLHGGLPGIPAVVPGRWLAEAPLGGEVGFANKLRALPAAALFVLDEAVLEADLDTPNDVEYAVAAGWVERI
ncbi:NTP transferase domain-containing protein [Lysobacter sp. 2RAF19]